MDNKFVLLKGHLIVSYPGERHRKKVWETLC